MVGAGEPLPTGILWTRSRTGDRPLFNFPPMSTKYYTHFLYEESEPKGLSEFRGVVEVNKQLRRGDFREAAALLARNFQCEMSDIKVLQWSRLH